MCPPPSPTFYLTHSLCRSLSLSLSPVVAPRMPTVIWRKVESNAYSHVYVSVCIYICVCAQHFLVLQIENLTLSNLIAPNDVCYLSFPAFHSPCARLLLDDQHQLDFEMLPIMNVVVWITSQIRYPSKALNNPISTCNYALFT